MVSDLNALEEGEKNEKKVKKILVADDRSENRYYLEKLLTGYGYQVVSVKNGEEAMEKLKSDKIDAIITDILMPVLDGYTLCQIVKKDTLLAHIPFIFYTASYTEARHREYGLSLGADEYISKPVEPESLLFSIRKILGEI
jgi:CheY-like chemotaxis protein